MKLLKKKMLRIFDRLGKRVNEEGALFGEALSNKDSANKSFLVTVITPVYNSSDKISRTIESVINQSLGFENIEYIIVDDCSSDGSQRVIESFSEKYENIQAILLERNSGTPALPRNIGLKMASAEYIFFLDADDWLAESGLETLYKIMIDTGDDYVVGKTIQIDEAGGKVIGRHESFKERRSVNVTSIPHIFQHLGPRARMLRKSVILSNNIQYPEMKYSEDKSFFIDYLSCCKRISTTRDVVYYLNRLEDNNTSLTKSTSVFEKHSTNVQIIKKVQNMNLDTALEKMINVRLLEFDCMTRLFNRQHFLRSSNKEKYYKAFREALDSFAYTCYPIEELPREPVNRLAIRLFKENRFEEFEKLYEWNVRNEVKSIHRKNGDVFYLTPLADDARLLNVRFLPVCRKSFFDEAGCWNVLFECFGDLEIKPEKLAIIFRSVEGESFFFDVEKCDIGYKAKINRNVLEKLPKGRYDLRVVFNEYELSPIREEGSEKFMYSDIEICQYLTVKENLALHIKSIH